LDFFLYIIYIGFDYIAHPIGTRENQNKKKKKKANALSTGLDIPVQYPLLFNSSIASRHVIR
jgi:hypothetical protein